MLLTRLLCRAHCEAPWDLKNPGLLCPGKSQLGPDDPVCPCEAVGSGLTPWAAAELAWRFGYGTRVGECWPGHPCPTPRPCHRVGLWESSPSISHNTTWMRLVSVCPGDSELGGFFTFQSVSSINNTQCLGPLSLHGSQINQVNTFRVGSLAGRALGHLTFHRPC